LIVEILQISSGAVLGANLRYWLVGKLHPVSLIWHFPMGVLVCNCLGCFLAGALISYGREQELSSLASRGILIGFLGSLTTFSSFAVDSLALWDTSSSGLYINLIGNVGGSLGFAILGAYICKEYWLVS